MEYITTDYSPCLSYLRQKNNADPRVKALSPGLRAAEILRRILMALPIGKITGESLAGDYGLMFADAEFRERVDIQDQPKPELMLVHAVSQQNHCLASFTPAHTTVCYDALVKQGLNGIISGLEARQAGADQTGDEYLDAEIQALRAICDWGSRYAELGFDACRRVPAQPPRSLLEALQAVWLVHTAVGIAEKCDASLSLGRIDQYLYPFYRADLDRGVPEEHLAAAVTDFFLKLNRYGDASGALNLGGVDAHGHDLFNDLTRLFIRVAAKLQMVAPILAAHIHPGLRREDFDLLTAPELFRIGQPSFYGEFSCRKALLQRGVPATDVHRWAANSCMGLMMPGEEFSDMWGIIFTFLLPLELALNHGRPLKGDLSFRLQTVCPEQYDNVAAILNTTIAYADELLAKLIKRHGQITAEEGANNPDPLVSALLCGGTAGRDRILGGPRYHTINVDAFALVNASDALTAIDHVVFQRQRHTLPELVEAARNNFEGQEALRLELLACPKYGNGNAAADHTVKELAARFAAIVRKNSDGRMTYMPSFHTLNFHVGLGAGWGAGLDGRRAGEPFAKNVGPMQGRNHNGLTAVLASAATIEQEFFYGGQALDLHIDAELVKTPADRAKFQAALQTYFQLGGLQIQVNGVNVDTLKKALVEPEKYADLTVRIGGYSSRFVDLSPEIQREMIERFQNNT